MRGYVQMHTHTHTHTHTYIYICMYCIMISPLKLCVNIYIYNSIMFDILLAAMDDKAARRGFTAWENDEEAGEGVVPLVLRARPGTRDFWNIQLDMFEGFPPQAALDHLPSKMLHAKLPCLYGLSGDSLTSTDSPGDLFKKKDGLFLPTRK
jgi:hypothetical protein